VVADFSPEELAQTHTLLATSKEYVASSSALEHDVLMVVWTPVRADGAVGKAVMASTKLVLNPPAAKDVTLEVVEEDAATLLPILKGCGAYADGVEGQVRALCVTLRARWVTLRARWVTLRARWVTLRARWVTLRARWVTLRAR
jgi:hypothetical protein